jgi:hypothetical protein
MTGGEELEIEDIKPQLLAVKFQRLKNSATKLARVLIVDENPIPQKQ